jgi:hypothetical protein
VIAKHRFALSVVLLVGLGQCLNWLLLPGNPPTEDPHLLSLDPTEVIRLPYPTTEEVDGKQRDVDSGNVQQASHWTTLTALYSNTANPLANVSLESVDETVDGDVTYRWKLGSGETEVRLFSPQGTVTLHLSGLPADTKYKLMVNGEHTGELSSSSEVVPLKDPHSVITLCSVDNVEVKTLGTIIRPSNVTPLIVEGYSPNEHLDYRDIPRASSTVSPPIQLFGERPILRLRGRQQLSNSTYSFQLATPVPIEQDNVFEVQPTPVASSVTSDTMTPGHWNQQLQLDLTPDAVNVDQNNHHILMRAIIGENHNFSRPIIVFNSSNRRPLSARTNLILRPMTEADGSAPEEESSTPYRINRQDWNFEFSITPINFPDDSIVQLRSSESSVPLTTIAIDNSVNKVTLRARELSEGTQELWAELWRGNVPVLTPENRPARSERITVAVRTTGPRVIRVEPEDFGTAAGVRDLRIFFNTENRLQLEANGSNLLTKLGRAITLRRSDEQGSFDFAKSSDNIAIEAAQFDPDRNMIALRFSPPQAALYQLRIDGREIQDVYGNQLEGEEGIPGSTFVRVLGERSVLDSLAPSEPSVRPGISGSTGEYVRYPEFTQPRRTPSGFNPHDKVETRVARLYYYRDAHRVAQIINRRVRSYNRQGVDTARQLADRARTLADQMTASRQAAERAAVTKAEETRRAEQALEETQRALNQTLRELESAQLSNQATPELLQQLQTAARSFGDRARRQQADVENARQRESEARETAQRLESDENLARSEQFRREVAAAQADPDTYAPGRPTSEDPVEQVSVSVIGEGLIHLRGPLKGINTIRTMIDQIDSPVGQVRISVHSAQINGEKQPRMENVANLVQLYIDQARFLTLQSSEMLRRAVVQVATRKADEIRHLYPGDSQQDRDRRYLDAFFGQDFIRELEAMDSEFLRTGNKLLSLHSMDTTSLASALNLLSLAKQSTRHEILAEFDSLIHSELPAAEARYIEAGLTAAKQCKLDLRHPPKFYPLAHNARFESLRAFFHAEVGHDDTMTPLQREFIRLAQIFKSRLVTEMEYKQRVMERAIIEERMGNPDEEYIKARQREREAEDTLRTRQRDRETHQVTVARGIAQFRGEVLSIDDEIREAVDFAELYRSVISRDVGSALTKVLDKDPLVQGLMEHERTSDELRSYLIRFRKEAPGKLMRRESLPKFTSFMDRLRELNDEFYSALEMELRRQEPDVTFKPAIPDYWFPGTCRYELWSFDFKINLKQGQVRILRGEDDIRKFLGQAKTQTLDSIHHIKDSFVLDPETTKRLNLARAAVENTNVDDVELVFENQLAIVLALDEVADIAASIRTETRNYVEALRTILLSLADPELDVQQLYATWSKLKGDIEKRTSGTLADKARQMSRTIDDSLEKLLGESIRVEFARRAAEASRRPLDHKKFLDMLIDQLEEKYIELLEGTRAHVANVDNYLKRLTTALDDDFNTQFYHPTFRYVRETSTYWDVQFGQTETTSVLTNNRGFAKVVPGATFEFDLPPRDFLLKEAMDGALANVRDFGALLNDPTFLSSTRLHGPQSTASPGAGTAAGFGLVRNVLPGLNSTTTEQVLSQAGGGGPQFGSNLENLIPDPAIYKFETGTGFEIRPVIQPDGQAVVFDFHYMYTTNVREPVRADEKHLGRVKRHFIDTDVQLSNFELREVSRYTVALKAARTGQGVPLLQDIPVVGALWRPLPSQESSLQQNIILAQATIFPTLFDLMGMRWAPSVADLDPLRLANDEFLVRGRHRALQNRVYDHASSEVDEFLRVPEGNRRPDLYRSQESIPSMHPNGYRGPGLDYRDSELQEGYQLDRTYPPSDFVPSQSREGALFLPGRDRGTPERVFVDSFPLDELAPKRPDPEPVVDPPTSSPRGTEFQLRP